MNEMIAAEVKARLADGGFSEQSVKTLADLLATHYPEHTAVLLGVTL